jgi:hypothetical protein
MKQNVTSFVAQCRVCLQYFAQGVEGDGDECYSCAEAEDVAGDFDREEDAGS